MEKTDQYTKKRLSESKLQDQYNLSDLVLLLETGLTPKEITKYGERRVRKFLDKITSGSPFIDDNTGKEVTLPQSENTELIEWLESCLRAVREGSPLPKVPQGLKAVLDDGTKLALGKIKKTKEFGGGIKGEVKTRIVEEGVVRELEKLLGRTEFTYPVPEKQEELAVLEDFKVKSTAGVIFSYFSETETGKLFVGKNLADYKITRTGGPVPEITKRYRDLSKGTIFEGMKKDKWNPADIWMYKDGVKVPESGSLKDLTEFCGPVPGRDNPIIGISLKKAGDTLFYRDPKRELRESGSLDLRLKAGDIKVDEITGVSMFTGNGEGESAEQCKYTLTGDKGEYLCQVRRSGKDSRSFRVHIHKVGKDYNEGSLGGYAALRILDQYINGLGENLEEFQVALEQEMILEGEDPLQLGEVETTPISTFLINIRALYDVDPDHKKVKEYLARVHRIAIADSAESCPFFICCTV